MKNKLSVSLRSIEASQTSNIGGSIIFLGMIGDDELLGATFIGSVKLNDYPGHLITGAIGFGRVSNISIFSESMIGQQQIGHVG